MAEHAPKAERHAEDLADDGRERRAADAQLRERVDAEDHQRVEDDVDDRAGQTLTHRDDHVAARLLDLLAHHRNEDENTHAHRDMRILDRKGRKPPRRTECADEYTRQPQPMMKNAMPPMTESATPCSAAKSAASCLLSPRRRAMSEFTPTPVPTPIATTSIWSG